MILNKLLLNNLTAKKFEARLKQADLMNKTDFDNKLTSFNKKNYFKLIKTQVRKKVDSLITKDYSFLLSRIYFTTNDVLKIWVIINQDFMC